MRRHLVMQGPVEMGLSRALLVLALLLAWVLPARADDDATIGMARERFKEGVQYFDQKQFDKARAAFLQAYALKRHPAVLLNLAQSELRSGHEAEAAKHFAQYLREHKEATDAERQGAESGLTTAKALVAELNVSVDEDGASVLVDGATEGTAPLPGPLYVSPGARTITARKDGREASAQLTASAGQSTNVSLRLKKPATAAPLLPAQQGEPETSAEPPPESSAEAPSEEPDTKRPYRPFFRWLIGTNVGRIGGALTILGAASGIGFGLAAKQSYDDADTVADKIRGAAEDDGINSTGVCRGGPALEEQLRPRFGTDAPARAQEYERACNKYSDNVDSGDRLKTFAILGTTVAAAAAVGTVVGYVLDGREQAPASGAGSARPVTARIVPWTLPGSHGVLVVGEF